MRNFLKKLLYVLPRSVRRNVVVIRDAWWRTTMGSWESETYPGLPRPARNHDQVRNILIYQIHGLTHSGTGKNLQLIANGLVETHAVYFMYGDKTAEKEREALLDPRVIRIPFSYETDAIEVPHKVAGMRPHLKEVLATHAIDLIITASPGYPHYPWNTVSEIPIILTNVFGAPAMQRNIAATVFMSETVRTHAEYWTGPQETHRVRLSPIGRMPPANTRALGSALREKLGISRDSFIFGRIGRDDDTIFDPIGIRAWQKIADAYPGAHYLIMSPPPVLTRMVELERIPRVHFLPPSGREEDVWAFHGAIDAMAHFRRDGETSGVAIAESLTVGNPIITHESHIWNAHLEYLDERCARIAGRDDVAGFAVHMKEFIHKKSDDPAAWEELCTNARSTGELHFSPQRYVDFIRGIVSLC